MNSSSSALLKLEETEINRLFDQSEIDYILKQRRLYTYDIPCKLRSSKSQLLRYLVLEMEILKLIAFRVHILKDSNSKNDLQKGIVERSNRLFKLVTRNFRSDCRPWMWFINFCKKLNVHDCFSNMIEFLVRAHSDKPRTWKFASRWEFEENSSIEKARDVLLRGLRILPYSTVLYKEAFRLELDFALHIRKQLNDVKLSDMYSVNLTSCGDLMDILANNAIKMPESRFRLIAFGGLAEVVYDIASNKIAEAEFIIDLIKIAQGYTFVDPLQHKMIRRLCKQFPDSELTWDVVARCELQGLQCFPDPLPDAPTPPNNLHSTSMHTNSYRQRVHRCTSVYNFAVKTLPTKCMWTLYLNTLTKLSESELAVPRLRKMNERLLRKGFAEAHSVGLMDDKFYLQWVRVAAAGRRKRFGYVLRLASEKLPTNVGLWQMRLAYSVEKGGQDEVVDVFRQALSNMRHETGSLLCVWTAVLEQGLSGGNAVVEKLFLEGMKPESPLAWHLRPMYLEWLTYTKGVDWARRAYETMRTEQPSYLQLHYTMADIELGQPAMDLAKVRRCYEFACSQYGSNCPDAWAQYAKLELMRGDLQSTYEIQRRALEALSPMYSDEFISKYSFLRSSIAIPKSNESSENME